MINLAIREKNETTKVFEVEVSREEVDSQFGLATEKIRKQAVLPGFRKGKVPLEMVAQKYVREIREEVMDSLFASSYQEAILQSKCVPIQQPKLEKMELDKGKPLTYQVEVEVLPKVTLGNYIGLKLKKAKHEVAAAELENIMGNLQNQHAALETVDNRPAQMHDVVTIDYDGKKDGQAVSGTNAKGYAFELGLGQTIPGFEEGIVGMVLNQIKTYSVKFPDDYHAQEMAGQTVEFTVSLKGIQNKKLPALDDAFAQQLGKFVTLDELKEKIHQDMLDQKERQSHKQLHEQIMQELSKSVKVKVPEILVERSLNSLIKDQEARLQRQSQTWETAGQSKEEFSQQNRKQVEQELKARLALREICVVEKIEVTAEELSAEVERLAQSMRQSPAVIRNLIEKKRGWEDMQDRVRDEKVLDWIISKAKISEA